MDKLKVLIAIIIIIIIIIIISILIIKSTDLEEVEKSQNLVSPGYEVEKHFEQKEELTRVEYNILNTSITSYIQSLNKNSSVYFGEDSSGNQISIVTEEEKYQKIINLLSKNYINNNKITVENLEQYIELKEEQLLFVPIRMKGMNTGVTKTYLVEGIVEDFNYNFKEDICLIVSIDYNNKTFSIEPTNQKYDDITTVQKIETIEKNENNQYHTTTVSMENIVNDYINLYKRLSLAKPEVAYEFLEEGYRNKRFGNVEAFKDYINKNKEEIRKIDATQYLVNNYKDYVEYIGKDKYDNQYIFRENAVLDFTFMLDTYTIISDKFKETYNSSKAQNKVMMNVDKWIQMLNNRDYTAAYNVLDETYRNNTFGSEEQFEATMREKLPLHYKEEYTNFSEENGTYIQNITLTDITGESEDSTQISVIMQLKEDYDFVMSFSFQE